MSSRFRAPLRIVSLAVFALFACTVQAQQSAPSPTERAPSDPRQPPPANVGATAQPTVPLGDLLADALDANPTLRAAQARVDAAMRRPAQASSLPDPMLGFTARNVGFPELTIGDEMMSVVGIRFTQEVPGGGKRPAREQVALDGIEVAQTRVDALRRRLIAEVAQTYYRIGFVDESIALIDDTRLLLQELERNAQARYSVGDALQQDVFKAQVELSRLLTQRAMLSQQRDSLVAGLNSLLHRPSSATLPLTARPELPEFPEQIEELQRSAAIRSAVLLEADRRIEQQQSSVELARVADKPDLVLSGGWMYRGGLPSIWEINIGVGLPIRKANRQEPATDEAIDELRALQQDRAAAGLEVEARVRDAWLRMDRARQLIEMYRDVILPQAALSLESTMSSYRVGQVDFLSVLDAIGKLLTFRTELERESADYYVAAAEMEMQLGRSLGATPDRVWTSPAVSPDTRTGGGAPRDGGSR